MTSTFFLTNTIVVYTTTQGSIRICIDRGNVSDIWIRTLERMLVMDLIKPNYHVITTFPSLMSSVIIKEFGIGLFNKARRRINELGV